MKSYIKYISVLVIILFQFCASAQTNNQNNFITISGTVLTVDNNKPMDFVSVEICNKKLKHEYCYTNENGNFQIKISSQLYFDSVIEVNIRLAGYLQNSTQNILVKSNFLELGNLYLTKDTSTHKNQVHCIQDVPPIDFESETPWQHFKRKIRRWFF